MSWLLDHFKGFFESDASIASLSAGLYIHTDDSRMRGCTEMLPHVHTGNLGVRSNRWSYSRSLKKRTWEQVREIPPASNVVR